MYQYIFKQLSKFFKPSTLFKYMFNLSPMYRRSTGRVKYVSENIHQVNIIIPLSIKNRNYVGTMFGGSLLSATDPIYMIQLLQILGDDYVVWDKSSTIHFKRPVNRNVYATFLFEPDEVSKIKKDVSDHGEIDITKTLYIQDKNKKVFSLVEKTIYISSKAFFKEKRKLRNRD